MKRILILAIALVVSLVTLGCQAATTHSPTTQINTTHPVSTTTSIPSSSSTASLSTTDHTTGTTTLAQTTESLTTTMLPTTVITTSVDDLVVPLLASMTLEEKAAQMVQAERAAISPEDVSQYGIGSILSGGGSHPSAYDDSYAVWYNMYRDFQAAALNSSSGIPILYGIDAIHGDNNLYGATIFPHNIGLGMANDPELTYQISKATAEEMLTTGIRWTFAPALSVVQNIRWGRTYEGYSENPEIHQNLAASAILGFEDNGVSATAKHYLGDGGTTDGIDQGNTVGTEPILRRLFLAPYEEAVAAGVDTIMVSYSSINGVKMHGNGYWVQDILKNELGFDGFVVSDWDGIHQLPGEYIDQVTSAINAGVDMLMEPYDWANAIQTIIDAVHQERITLERINDAVTRILKVKFNRGLFDDPFFHLDSSYLYNQAHQDLARQAVRESLVLLKNDQNALPFDKSDTFYLTGPGSDNVGYQCGGWTTYWQGNTSPDIGVGESILDGMTSVLDAHGGSWTDNWMNANVVVVVLSEMPYSESAGDNDHMTLVDGNADPGNLAAIQLAATAHLAGKTVIGILLSGRPLILGGYLDAFDAFVAAWLPGSEGGNGIADVLFGDYDFTGKLSYTWPADYSQIGYTSNRDDYDPDVVAFPYGYGLTYSS